jgi:hypothetical protein
METSPAAMDQQYLFDDMNSQGRKEKTAADLSPFVQTQTHLFAGTGGEIIR